MKGESLSTEYTVSNTVIMQ